MKAMVTTSLFLCFSSLILGQTPKCIENQYELVWQDEFDGKTIDTSKWTYRAVGSKRGNAYVKKENCYVDGKGHLIIEARKPESDYTVGQIATQGLNDWKFGYFECRAKMTEEAGVSCAFWLQSPGMSKGIKDAKKAGAEIDIFEYRRINGKNRAHFTVHWGGYGDSHEQKSKIRRFLGLSKGFHTFGLEWTAEAYIFYVDGKQKWETSTAVSHVKQYIILSVEMVDWAGDPSSSSFPDKAVYDYVRVYKRKR